VASTVTIEQKDGIKTVRIGRAHGNAINGELVDDLIAAFQGLEEERETRGVLLTSTGKLFSPGLDLQELTLLDRAEMEDFVRRFGSCILMLYTCSKPVVAAMQGDAIAGGCILALTADWRILCGESRMGLAEVKVGVPFPFGVSMILRESVPRAHLTEVALFGRNYRGAEAVEVGLAHEQINPEEFDAHCLARLQELADKDPGAFAVTKRYLRSSSVERIRAYDQQFVGDFLDAWFSDATRARIAGLLEGLQKKKG